MQLIDFKSGNGQDNLIDEAKTEVAKIESVLGLPINGHGKGRKNPLVSKGCSILVTLLRYKYGLDAGSIAEIVGMGADAVRRYWYVFDENEAGTKWIINKYKELYESDMD
jgi:hypothetical protein